MGHLYGLGFAQLAGSECAYKPGSVLLPEDKRQLHRFFQEAGAREQRSHFQKRQQT